MVPSTSPTMRRAGVSRLPRADPKPKTARGPPLHSPRPPTGRVPGPAHHSHVLELLLRLADGLAHERLPQTFDAILPRNKCPVPITVSRRGCFLERLAEGGHGFSDGMEQVLGVAALLDHVLPP